MNALTIGLLLALAVTVTLLIRSLFRQAGIQDAMKETSEGAADQLKLWEEFGQHLDESVALVDEHGAITYANTAFAELTQWPSRSSFHQPLASVLQFDAEAKPVDIPEGEARGGLFVLGKDGRRTAIARRQRPLHKPAGYSVVVLQNTTAENAEKELRHRLVNLSSFELRAPVTAMKGMPR
ncbi:MAG: PAS domain-containing protein [Hymenobacter sp.]